MLPGAGGGGVGATVLALGDLNPECVGAGVWAGGGVAAGAEHAGLAYEDPPAAGTLGGLAANEEVLTIGVAAGEVAADEAVVVSPEALFSLGIAAGNNCM